MAQPAVRPRVLLTGPTRGLEDWARAAEGAGWEALSLPLVETHPRAARLDELPEAVDWICVTSSSALAWLEQALALRPSLARARLAVVGARSAERLAALGLAPALAPARDADELADALEHALASESEARRAPPALLWPRGPLSEELALRLRARGARVHAPLAYDSVARAADAPAPAARATFFASPSGVRAFRALPGASAATGSALAIGRSTLAALLEETALGFLDTIALPEPTPQALAWVLAHLDPHAPGDSRGPGDASARG